MTRTPKITGFPCAARRLALAVLCMLVLAGCGTASAGTKADVVQTASPLRAPVWAPEQGELLALNEEGSRVVRLNPASGKVDGSVAVGKAGEDMALDDTSRDELFVPQPNRERIIEINTQTMRKERSFRTGFAPSYVAMNSGSDTLFFLSDDGSEVSGVDLQTREKVPAIGVGGNQETLLEAPEKGAVPAFWTAEPKSVAYYYGDPPEKLGEKKIAADEISVDTESLQRAYVAEGSTLTALEGGPQRFLAGRLYATKSRDLGAEIGGVTSDDLYLYAATGDEFFAMERESLQPLERVDIGGLLRGKGLGSAEISGIATDNSADRVYLTLEGEPYVLRIEKP
jgi:hypothetical protein